ncbi:hypothetical protein AeRB84_019136 [Aphanomyces euteiches]|nr:hypothetical protein AeRB84_019136 [Aphanomyces euteiches]
MEQLLIDALDTLPDEDVLARSLDELITEEFEIFHSPASSDSTATTLPAVNSSDALTHSSSSSSPISTEATVGKSAAVLPKTIYLSRKRQRDEIEYLRSKVEELEQHLRVLQHVKAREGADETPWQRKANRVRMAKQAALHENEKLKHELEEQIQFGKALQTLMMNRPKLTVLPTLQSEQWRIHKLFPDPALRRQAIEEIYNKQFQLPDCAMLESELQGGVDCLESFTPRLARSTADLVLCTSYSKVMDMSVDIVSEFAWLMLQRKCKGWKDVYVKVLEKYCSNSIYMRVKKNWADLTIEGNCLYKRFIASDRHVMVSRVVVEKLQDGQGCQVKYFFKCTPAMVQSHFGASYMDNDAAMARFHQVDRVTDSVLSTLKVFVGHFGKSLSTLLANYDGNVVETFNRVSSTWAKQSQF